MTSSKTIFDNYFPNDILSIAEGIVKMRKKYNSSVPKLLAQNGFYNLKPSCTFMNPNKRILLYYKTSDSKTKRNERLNELVQVSSAWSFISDYELVYGYLRSCKLSSGDDNAMVTMYNKTIRIMSGEELLKYLFNDDKYNEIINDITQEINSSFSFIVSNNS